MKKILYIITKSNWGGAQKYVHDLAVGVPEGYTPVVALGPSAEKDGVGELAERLEKAGVRTLLVKAFQRDINPLKELWSFIVLMQILRREKPAVVHVNSSKAGGLGALAARLLGVERIIFTAHGWAFNEKRHCIARTLIALASWFTTLLSHTTILVSHFDRERARWMPFAQKKLVVIHNGIDPHAPLPAEEARVRLFRESPHADKISASSLIIGTVAELTSNKGLSYALEAMSILREKYPHITLALIGEGDERAQLETLIAKHDLAHTVFLLGALPEAGRLMKAFDIFLLSSVKEGLPYTLLEAGHAGVAVVATAVGGIPEIIDDVQSGLLVKPQRPKEIADALSFLLEHPDKRARFGTALKEKVGVRFSIEVMRTKTYQLYKTVQ